MTNQATVSHAVCKTEVRSVCEAVFRETDGGRIGIATCDVNRPDLGMQDSLDNRAFVPLSHLVLSLSRFKFEGQSQY